MQMIKSEMDLDVDVKDIRKTHQIFHLDVDVKDIGKTHQIYFKTKNKHCSIIAESVRY